MAKTVMPTEQLLLGLIEIHVAARHRRRCGGKGVGNILLDTVRVSVTDREIAARIYEDLNGATSNLRTSVAT
jgi:hypothetical protein